MLVCLNQAALKWKFYPRCGQRCVRESTNSTSSLLLHGSCCSHQDSSLPKISLGYALSMRSRSRPSLKWLHPISDQIRSVAQSCLTLCNLMNRSTPGVPVHHQLPEFTQTHVHQVSDAIQPSHLLSSPSPLAPNPSQHHTLYQWVNSSHEVAKVLEFQLSHHSFQRNPRADLLQNGLDGSPCSPRDPQESSPTPQFKSINSSALSLLHSPTLTSIHDHRKNHSLD